MSMHSPLPVVRETLVRVYKDILSLKETSNTLGAIILSNLRPKDFGDSECYLMSFVCYEYICTRRNL